MRKQHDLRMRIGLVFGQEFGHCLTVLLQILCGCRGACRHCCSPKARAGDSGPCSLTGSVVRRQHLDLALPHPAALSYHANNKQPKKNIIEASKIWHIFKYIFQRRHLISLFQRLHLTTFIICLCKLFYMPN